MDYVSGIYKGNAQSDYFNTLVADTVEKTIASGIKALKTGEKIKILETGAGTGGTSEFIFQKLTQYKDHIEYHYTDISKSFLLYAEETLPGTGPLS